MVVWIQNPFDNLPGEGFRKQRYWMMADAFVRAGHHVVLWSSDFSHATKCHRARVATTETCGFDVQLIPTLPYTKNVGFARLRSHRNYARNWLRLAREFEGPRPDFIICSIPTISGAEAALQIGLEKGSRVVVDVMDAWPETFERLAPRGARGLAHLLLAPWRRRAQRVYRSANLVTGVSERYRELTRRNDYFVAYHGIDFSDQASSRETSDDAKTQKIRLVYSGNLGCTYDLKTVIRAVSESPDMELEVAGFGNFKCENPRVHFHGLLQEDDLRALFSSCDIGVIPMRSESWVGVPYKFCDYSRAGLPIVSSLGGETAALLSRFQCGVSYIAGDVRSLVSAIRKAATLPRDHSKKMCAEVFEATRIYDGYVRFVCQ